MTIQEQMTTFTEVSRDSLVDSARRGDPYIPVVAVFRGEDVAPVAVLLAMCGSEELFDYIKIIALGFDASLLVLAVDAYRTTEASPIDVGRWKPGEMAAYFEAGNVGGKVTEALVITGCTRDGMIISTEMPYLRGEDGSIGWTGRHELSTGEDGKSVEGRVPAALREAWDGDRLPVESEFDRLAKDAILEVVLSSMGMVSVQLAAALSEDGSDG